MVHDDGDEEDLEEYEAHLLGLGVWGTGTGICRARVDLGLR